MDEILGLEKCKLRLSKSAKGFFIPRCEESYPLLAFFLFLWCSMMIFQYIEDEFTGQKHFFEAILLLLICNGVQNAWMFESIFYKFICK